MLANATAKPVEAMASQVIDNNKNKQQTVYSPTVRQHINQLVCKTLMSSVPSCFTCVVFAGSYDEHWSAILIQLVMHI